MTNNMQIFLSGLADAVPGSNEFADQGANPIWKVILALSKTKTKTKTKTKKMTKTASLVIRQYGSGPLFCNDF